MTILFTSDRGAKVEKPPRERLLVNAEYKRGEPQYFSNSKDIRYVIVTFSYNDTDYKFKIDEKDYEVLMENAKYDVVYKTRTKELIRYDLGGTMDENVSK